ncbi:MAG: secretin and TonB N-terminal domain-containing protein [Pirellulales bacterium]|nr:secretin and TonB N-terminal domain-containing protein [Pirellulales bacterium]
MSRVLRVMLLLMGALAGLSSAVYLAARTPQQTTHTESGHTKVSWGTLDDPDSPGEPSPATATTRSHAASPKSIATAATEPLERQSAAPPITQQSIPGLTPESTSAGNTSGVSGALGGAAAALGVDPQKMDMSQVTELLQSAMQTLQNPGASTNPLVPAASGAPSMNVAPATPPAVATEPRTRKSEILPAPQAGEGDANLHINIQNEDLRDVLELLSKQSGLNILASKNVGGSVSAVLNNVTVDEALSAILKSTGFTARREGNFIFVGTPQDFVEMDHTSDRIGTRIYRPNYITAIELQQLIEPLLTSEVGKSSVTTAAATGIGSDDTQVGGDSFSSGDAVLVQDYEQVLNEIDQVLDELDKRPVQVAIDAMILSVKLGDKLQVGVNWQFLRNKDTIRFGIGTPRTVPFADPTDPFTFTGGLTFDFLDSSLGSFLNFLETIGDTNVIASPHLMVLDKQRAEILIGAQLGYISTTVTETSTTQSVEFLEVGAQLRLRPYVSTDGLIRMEVHPELSTGAVPVREGFTLPEKEVTQVTTNIMVRDGCTVIIGGLMREDLKTTTTQVPVVGNLPYVGFLFRNTTEDIEKREILVLITPHIVYEPETCRDGECGAMEFHRRQAVYRDHMSPLGKRYLGRIYFRKAQAAWAAGDYDAALRLAQCSVQFDPTNRAAIELTTDIVAGRHDGPYSGGEMLPPGEKIELLDSDGEIPPWVLDSLERELAPAPAGPPAEPKHPLEPGVPGDIVPIERY